MLWDWLAKVASLRHPRSSLGQWSEYFAWIVSRVSAPWLGDDKAQCPCGSVPGMSLYSAPQYGHFASPVLVMSKKTRGWEFQAGVWLVGQCNGRSLPFTITTWAWVIFIFLITSRKWARICIYRFCRKPHQNTFFEFFQWLDHACHHQWCGHQAHESELLQQRCQ